MVPAQEQTQSFKKEIIDFLNQIDNISQPDWFELADKQAISKKIEGEIPYEELETIIDELLGSPDNGAINYIAEYINYKEYEETLSWRYPDEIIEDDYGEKYVGQLVINFTNMNDEKVRDVELIYYVKRLEDD